ncbi:glyoxalase [Winogradskyella ludwigii]|uniref:glyoxalase n=1 Tax=Winogradskyella ludwigii TaxID=2686076 RepID=UPI0015CDB6C8|nr:glyoxalase [Winogradskyella ludwigii]
MTSRSKNLLDIRPEITSARTYEGMSTEEAFQNTTLRPVIKLQHDLLMAVFSNYIAKRKNVFFELELPKQLEYIEHAVQKDTKFRNNLKGLIIGQFTVEEYDLYTQNSSALNKRIITIIKERLIHSIQLFSKPKAK